MTKRIYVQNPNYIRPSLKTLINNISNNQEPFKKAAELRMACYDAQPKLVRQLIGEVGMGNQREALLTAKTTKQKCDILRKMNDRKLTNSANYIDI